MPINWDGSYLGKYPLSAVIAQSTSGNNKYCQIELPQDEEGEKETIYCGFRTLTNTDPLIIDEMKPLFNLQKMGTHWIELGSHKYLLYRVPLCDVIHDGIIRKKIQEEFTLDQVNHIFVNDQPFRREVQKIFSFREALGVRMTYESSIRVRVGVMDNVFPVSCREPSILCNKEAAIPKTIINRWFDTTSIPSILRSMIGMSSLSPTTTIFTFRQKVEKVINRIDKDKIYYSSNFLERIFTRILVQSQS